MYKTVPMRLSRFNSRNRTFSGEFNGEESAAPTVSSLDARSVTDALHLHENNRTILSGWLSKRTTRVGIISGRPIFNKRFFILRNYDVLSSQRTPAELAWFQNLRAHQPNGSIILQSTCKAYAALDEDEIDQHKFAFELCVPHSGRIYSFRARTAGDRAAWVGAIQSAILGIEAMLVVDSCTSMTPSSLVADGPDADAWPDTEGRKLAAKGRLEGTGSIRSNPDADDTEADESEGKESVNVHKGQVHPSAAHDRPNAEASSFRPIKQAASLASASPSVSLPSAFPQPEQNHAEEVHETPKDSFTAAISDCVQQDSGDTVTSQYQATTGGLVLQEESETWTSLTPRGLQSFRDHSKSFLYEGETGEQEVFECAYAQVKSTIAKLTQEKFELCEQLILEETRRRLLSEQMAFAAAASRHALTEVVAEYNERVRKAELGQQELRGVIAELHLQLRRMEADGVQTRTELMNRLNAAERHYLQEREEVASLGRQLIAAQAAGSNDDIKASAHPAATNQSKENEIATLRGEIEQHRMSMAEERAERARQNAQLQTLQGQAEEAEAQCADLEEENADLGAELVQRRECAKTLSKDLEGARVGLEELKAIRDILSLPQETTTTFGVITLLADFQNLAIGYQKLQQPRAAGDESLWEVKAVRAEVDAGQQTQEVGRNRSDRNARQLHEQLQLLRDQGQQGAASTLQLEVQMENMRGLPRHAEETVQQSKAAYSSLQAQLEQGQHANGITINDYQEALRVKIAMQEELQALQHRPHALLGQDTTASAPQAEPDAELTRCQSSQFMQTWNVVDLLAASRARAVEVAGQARETVGAMMKEARMLHEQLDESRADLHDAEQSAEQSTVVIGRLESLLAYSEVQHQKQEAQWRQYDKELWQHVNQLQSKLQDASIKVEEPRAQLLADVRPWQPLAITVSQTPEDRGIAERENAYIHMASEELTADKVCNNVQELPEGVCEVMKSCIAAENDMWQGSLLEPTLREIDDGKGPTRENSLDKLALQETRAEQKREQDKMRRKERLWRTCEDVIPKMRTFPEHESALLYQHSTSQRRQKELPARARRRAAENTAAVQAHIRQSAARMSHVSHAPRKEVQCSQIGSQQKRRAPTLLSHPQRQSARRAHAYRLQRRMEGFTAELRQAKWRMGPGGWQVSQGTRYRSSKSAIRPTGEPSHDGQGVSREQLCLATSPLPISSPEYRRILKDVAHMERKAAEQRTLSSRWRFPM